MLHPRAGVSAEPDATEMSEKYKQIGAPMNQLPRPVTTGNYSRIESALSAADRGGTGSIRFHDCSNNANMTILRDLKEMVVRTNFDYQTSPVFQ